MLKTLMLALSVILLVGCSAQTQLYWKALQQESDSIEPVPVDAEPVPLKPVVHRMHKVRGGKEPRLKNRIGAAATPGVKLTLNQMAGFDIKNERFRIYVPKGYTDDIPHGLLVYIASSSRPGIPISWVKIFAQKKLIWIAPFRAGNGEKASRRIRLALEARKHALLNYNIAPNRVYVSGVSGGGVTCSTILSLYPDAFNGSIHIVGASGFQRSNRQKLRWVSPNISTRHNGVSDSIISKLRQNNRFVLIAGRNDWGYYKVMRNAYTSMRKLGFGALFIDITGLGHEFPQAKFIVQALDYLGGPR